MSVVYGGGPYFSLVSLPVASGVFQIPTLPTPSSGSQALLRPNWTAVSATKDPFRAWVSAVIDGIAYFANGWDQPWYVDVNTGHLWPLGSVAPTSFVVADAPGGATFAAGTVLVYYLVFRNADMGEETAPQATADSSGNLVAGVTHAMAGTKDALITWSISEAGTRWSHVDVYRQLQNSSGFVRVGHAAVSAGTFTDSTADANVSTAVQDAYVPRYRLTLPPVFKGLAAYQGILFGFDGKSANLYYSQQSLPTGELVTTDFPAGNILPIEIDDGLGEITAVVTFYGTMYVFKRRGVYSVTGSDVTTFAVTRMFGDRGCIGPRCVVPVFASLYFLDERGMFGWVTSSEPVVVGAQVGVATPLWGKRHLDEPSPLGPFWNRLNLDAADMMQVVHNESLGYVEAYVAIDNEPQARHRVRAFYRKDRYESIDGMVSHACGTLYDGVETPYVCRLDDLGLLWQNDVAGDSEGVFAGDTTGAVASIAGQVLSLPAAAVSTSDLLGPRGCPVDRYDANGNVVDENRVVNVADGTHLELLRWCSAAYAAGDTAAWGVIRDLFELPIMDYSTGDWKTIQHVLAEFDVKSAGVLRIDTAADGSAYVERKEIDLTNAKQWALVPCWDRGFTWRMRGYSRYAGVGYSVRALRMDWRAHRKRI